MIISDCGQLKVGDSWNYYDEDETEDNLPPFPNDWMEMPTPSDIPVRLKNTSCVITNVLKKRFYISV